MPSLKDIRTRIGGVKKTRQITSAMKLVAAAKLRRATERALSARPYQKKLGEVMSSVAARAEGFESPLMTKREQVKTIHVTLVTTDRGLCGPFNGTLLRHAYEWFQERKQPGVEVKIRVYGRRGRDFLVYRGWEVDAVVGYDRTPKMELVRDLGTEVIGGFLEGKWDEAWLFYNEYVNTITQRPKFVQIAPLVLPAGKTEGQTDYAYEPNANELLTRLLPLYLRTTALQAFLESEAGENAARMTAMDNATRNATDIINALNLQYNRARQAAITKEIIEIVSGAEAL